MLHRTLSTRVAVMAGSLVRSGRGLFLGLVMTTAGLAITAADDSDPPDLKQAKETYAKRHAKALEQLLAGIDKKLQQATKAGDPGLALALKADHDFVKRTKRLPLARLLAPEAAQFERSIAGP